MSGPSKVRIGSDLTEFPGRSFNALVSQWYRSQAEFGRRGPKSSGPGQVLTVKARNVTGVLLEYGHCVAIEGLAIPYADKAGQQYARPLIKANIPDGSVRHSILGVCTGTVDKGGSGTEEEGSAGTFIYSGPAWLRCNVTSTAHDFVELEPNQSVFTELARSSASGYPILAKELETTGEQWVLALLGGGGGSGIYAQVNEPGGVTSGDATFSFDNAISLGGAIPAGGTGTAQNQYGQEYDDDDWVILQKRKDNGNWITERGGTAGSVVRFFRLTGDLSYTDEFALAKPTQADWTVDSGADAVYLLNPQTDGIGQFYGLAPYTDGNTAAVAHPGYLAAAVKYTDDFDDGGGPTGAEGWRIIEMEGPATQLLVSLAASYSMGGTQCQMVADDGGPWGESFGARLPRIEHDDYDVIVDDDLDMTSGGTVGGEEDDIWWIHWDRDDEKYVFWRRKETAATLYTGIFQLQGACDGATLSSDTLTPGTGDAYRMLLDDPEADPFTWTVDDSIEFTLHNTTPDTVASGSIVQAKTIEGVWFIDVVNCSAYS